MKRVDLMISGILNECIYTSSRGGGPGGQNVNKVSTKVELRFNVKDSRVLTENEKRMIMSSLGRKINKEGVLILTSQAERSQLQNKTNVSQRFINLIKKSLSREKKRISTTPTPLSRQKRMENKKRHAELKKLRNAPEQSE
jgi:ribosome-associated protein